MTVLFGSGSEFLVCKVETCDKNVTHVYLRNVQLGLSEQTTLMWTDDQIFTTARFEPFSQLLAMRMQASKSDHEQDFQVIMKSTSLAAWAYMKSPFFYLSYKMC